MILPYDFKAGDWKRILELADKNNVKQNGTFEVGAGGRLILRDANGGRWQLVVSTSGVLSTVTPTS
jgi:hypothetical protein